MGRENQRQRDCNSHQSTQLSQAIKPNEQPVPGTREQRRKQGTPEAVTGRSRTGKSTAPTPEAKMPRAAILRVLLPSRDAEKSGTHRKATKANFGRTLEKLEKASKSGTFLL